MACITEVATSKDGRVRQVEVMTALNGVKKTYRRPVTDLVLLSKTKNIDDRHLVILNIQWHFPH